jgi:hypothetical protein
VMTWISEHYIVCNYILSYSRLSYSGFNLWILPLVGFYPLFYFLFPHLALYKPTLLLLHKAIRHIITLITNKYRQVI